MATKNISRVKIVDRKLGRQKAWGMCNFDTKLLEVDPRQDSKNYLDTMVHEMLHLYFPDEPEWRITKVATRMTNELWKRKYRRIQT